jgi:hypothetical protein
MRLEFRELVLFPERQTNELRPRLNKLHLQWAGGKAFTHSCLAAFARFRLGNARIGNNLADGNEDDFVVRCHR